MRDTLPLAAPPNARSGKSNSLPAVEITGFLALLIVYDRIVYANQIFGHRAISHGDVCHGMHGINGIARIQQSNLNGLSLGPLF